MHQLECKERVLTLYDRKIHQSMTREECEMVCCENDIMVMHRAHLKGTYRG